MLRHTCALLDMHKHTLTIAKTANTYLFKHADLIFRETETHQWNRKNSLVSHKKSLNTAKLTDLSTLVSTSCKNRFKDVYKIISPHGPVKPFDHITCCQCSFLSSEHFKEFLQFSSFDRITWALSLNWVLYSNLLDNKTNNIIFWKANLDFSSSSLSTIYKNFTTILHL